MALDALPEDALRLVAGALPWSALLPFARASRACHAAASARLHALRALRRRPWLLADPHAPSWDLAWRGLASVGDLVAELPERRAEHVTTLDLSQNVVRAFDGAALAYAFPALHTLDLRCNLVTSLANVPPLRHLNLAGNKLRAVSARVRPGSTLRVLDLRDNALDSHGAETVAALARDCAGLLDLRVALNWIGDAGALKLVAVALGHPAMQLLDLRDNPFGYQTVDAATRAMNVHTPGCFIALL